MHVQSCERKFIASQIVLDIVTKTKDKFRDTKCINEIKKTT